MRCRSIRVKFHCQIPHIIIMWSQRKFSAPRDPRLCLCLAESCGGHRVEAACPGYTDLVGLRNYQEGWSPAS